MVEEGITAEPYPADVGVKKWREKLKQEGTKPEEVIGEIIIESKGKIKDWTELGEDWKPTYEGKGIRDMIFLAGKFFTPRLGAESLRAGISLVIPIKDQSQEGKNKLMVPYPRFDHLGNYDAGSSRVGIFTEDQIRDLSKILAGIKKRG